jgi:hypothetical protein
MEVGSAGPCAKIPTVRMSSLALELSLDLAAHFIWNHSITSHYAESISIIRPIGRLGHWTTLNTYTLEIRLQDLSTSKDYNPTSTIATLCPFLNIHTAISMGGQAQGLLGSHERRDVHV